jgi:hypothetical protein
MATLVSLTDDKEAVFFNADISPRQLQEISVTEDVLEVTTGQLCNVEMTLRLLVQELIGLSTRLLKRPCDRYPRPNSSSGSRWLARGACSWPRVV